MNALAVEEDLLDLDDQGQHGPVALDHHVVEPRGVRDQSGPAVDAEGVAASGDEEDQSGVGVLQDVEVAVDPLVALALRDRERPLVEDLHEPGRVALRRGVAPTGCVGRRHDAERRRRDPVAVELVQARAHLVADAGERLPDQRPQLFGGVDAVGVGVHGAILPAAVRGPGQVAYPARRPGAGPPPQLG